MPSSPSDLYGYEGWSYDARRDEMVNVLSGQTIDATTFRKLLKTRPDYIKRGNYMQRKPHIGLDFETYGSVDLTVHGLDRYSSDKYFTPLIAHLYFREGPGVEGIELAFDFVEDYEMAKRGLQAAIHDKIIVAHNAGFEAAVLDVLGLHHPIEDFIDSAVIARAAGAASKLEAAAPQLLGVDKMAEGWPLIKLFSLPGPYQERNDSPEFDPQIVADHPDEWATFKEYCALDAKLSHAIVDEYLTLVTAKEMEFQAATMRMNDQGWNVDLELVKEMQRRYLENLDALEQEFRARCNAKDLNLNSHAQLVMWCRDRGIKAKSFDEKHVASLHRRITHKLENGTLTKAQREGYEEVVLMLETKRELGGSSLKKLQKILDTTGDDGRLRDQYLHCGAGQTLRTTGRDVQMQNLKRLGEDIDDVEELHNLDVEWDNPKMARNLRQVFTATWSDGALIVGDFKQVEALGLAWLAGETQTIADFKAGKPMYEAAAARSYGIAIEAVTKSQRQFGKVGILSCGYQAGAGAVKDFAENMGVILTEGEASQVVADFRDSNPRIVAWWGELDAALRECVEVHNTTQLPLPDGFSIIIRPMATPSSLKKIAPRQHVSVAVEVHHQQLGLFLRRVFLGCHFVGKNIRYYRPSDRKTGDLWKPQYTDSKTGQIRDYTIYGGKLAGILTQSFCRELFFHVLLQVQAWCDSTNNVYLVGQFHDEIVLEWKPGNAGINSPSLTQAELTLEQYMSDPGMAYSFPLKADVKSAYRYIK